MSAICDSASCGDPSGFVGPLGVISQEPLVDCTEATFAEFLGRMAVRHFETTLRRFGGDYEGVSIAMAQHAAKK